MDFVRAASPLPARSRSPLPMHSGLRSLTPTRFPNRYQRATILGRSDSYPVVMSAASSSTAGSQARSRVRPSAATPLSDSACFSTLGLPSSASAPQIRQAYRTLAKMCHPDVARDDPASAAHFVELRSAYERCLKAAESQGCSKAAESQARRCQSAPRKSRLETEANSSKFGRDLSEKAASGASSNAQRTSRRRASRPQDAWDIFDEVMASPKSSRRHR